MADCVSQSDCPTSVQVFTHNITRRPIAWDPRSQKPTQEVVHSIHAALHFALDPCVNHPDEEPSFCQVNAPFTTEASSSEKTSRLIIPCVNDIVPVSPENSAKAARSELSVKLFAGFNGAVVGSQDVDEALEALKRTTGVAKIHQFVLSLDGIKWNGGNTTNADGESEWEVGVEVIETLSDAWKACLVLVDPL